MATLKMTQASQKLVMRAASLENYNTPFLHEVLEVSLDLTDYALTLRTPDGKPAYAMHAYRWHAPTPTDSRCQICIAGSLMATWSRWNSSIDLHPRDFEDGRRQRLIRALDFLRQLHVSRALYALNNRSSVSELAQTMSGHAQDWWRHYEASSGKFSEWRNSSEYKIRIPIYRRLVDRLKEEGL